MLVSGISISNGRDDREGGAGIYLRGLRGETPISLMLDQVNFTGNISGPDGGAVKAIGSGRGGNTGNDLPSISTGTGGGAPAPGNDPAGGAGANPPPPSPGGALTIRVDLAKIPSADDVRKLLTPGSASVIVDDPRQEGRER